MWALALSNLDLHPHRYALALCILLTFVDVRQTQGKKEQAADRTRFINKEIERLEKITSCYLPSVTRTGIHGSWLKDKTADETCLCALKLLQVSPDEGFVWALLGTSFEQRNNKQKADFCFKQSTKLLGKHSEFVKEWSYVAPFVTGKTEFDGDPLLSYGGITNVSRFRFDSKPTPKFFSELAAKGTVGWGKARQSNMDSMVQIRPQLDWNDLVTSLGSMGITEWQGWAVGEIVVNENNLPLAIRCLGVAKCFVNKVMLVGDLYHRQYFWSPLIVTRGVHSVFVPLRTKVAANFKVSISAKLPKFKLHQPSFLPDLYKGYYPGKVYIPVLVCNSMSEEYLSLTKVEVVSQSAGKKLQSHLVDPTNIIAPGQIRPISVQLFVAEDKDKTTNTQVIEACDDKSPIELDLKVRTSAGSEILKLNLRCRQKGSSFLFTFLDHDGSVQHAAAIEPLGHCEASCPVVLSLHGTTVPPQNQADSYKKMVNGNFQFGVKGMWLLAPTRHGAHNWEGPGALTAMSALEALQQLSQQKTMFQYKADSSRVVFAGHSMGGHGAWHLATHYPDRAIGLVSLAGWIKKEEYGDSNLFFRHDIATSFADPSLKAIMEACVAENDVDKHLSNLKGIPVLARIGENDRTVHPYFVRRMVRLFRAADVDVTYSEIPGQEHWWWDTKEANDGGCVNDGQIRKFFDKIATAEKSEAHSASPAAELDSCSSEDTESCGKKSANSLLTEAGSQTETFTLVVMNPALGEGLKGIVVLQQQVPLRRSTIQVHTDGISASFVTENILCFQIKDGPLPNRSLNIHSLKTLKLDGITVDFSRISPPYIMCRNSRAGSNEWEHAPNLYQETSDIALRGPHNYGPARRIAERPFIIVVGTRTGNAILLQHAVYIANQFLATSDTSVPIKEDKSVRKEDRENFNLIVIGSPKENLLAQDFLDLLPDLQLKGEEKPRLRVGTSCQYEDPHTGILTLAPQGSKGLALLLMGLSPQGLEDVVKLATPTIPPMARSPFSNLLPDFVITGPDTGLKGPGGFLCAGFWNNTWGFSVASASCVCGA
ncbi:afadin-and alpha-actinin-binding protein [Plakobranchus ocellatus]|uniref:Afadin-and alpha-actinin-binding protein n=1 Tax=Plakobranchus ocellatus TaxID=259542 RepID=A0AAV4DPK0_9GAST|nr:afadin-and alpha-actinin-binding protein [Plakobranchus ocellatus]